MNQHKNIIKKELSISRTINAPIDLLWDVWTKTHHILKWLGQNGLTTSIDKLEFIPGGEWRFVMIGPDGKRYLNKIIFFEILPNKKIVVQHYSRTTRLQ